MKIKTINLKDIEQNENSRVVYKEVDLIELIQSMKKDGQLQPIGVKELKGGKYEAVWGNRRIVAAKKLGWVDISANVVEAETDNDRDILNLVENMKRQNTTVSEDGRIFDALTARGLSVPEIAARLDIKETRVELALEVFRNVPKEFKPVIVNRAQGKSSSGKGKISASAAHTILNLKKTHSLSNKKTKELLTFARDNDVSTAQLHQIAPMLDSGMSLQKAIVNADKLERFVISVFIHKDRARKIEKKFGTTVGQVIAKKMEMDADIQAVRWSQTNKYESVSARTILRRAAKDEAAS